MNFANRLQPLGLLVLRLALGTVMIAHGYQKIANHLQNISGMLHGLQIPQWMAYLVVAAEFGGGILLVAGFLTRIAAIAIFLDMAVAISKGGAVRQEGDVPAQLFLNEMALRGVVISYRIESVQELPEEVLAAAQEN